jgi:hypothetical protein
MSDGQRDEPREGYDYAYGERALEFFVFRAALGLFLNGWRSEHAPWQATGAYRARPGRRAAGQAPQRDPAWAAAQQGPYLDHAFPFAACDSHGSELSCSKARLVPKN